MKKGKLNEGQTYASDTGSCFILYSIIFYSLSNSTNRQRCQFSGLIQKTGCFEYKFKRINNIDLYFRGFVLHVHFIDIEKVYIIVI